MVVLINFNRRTYVLDEHRRQEALLLTHVNRTTHAHRTSMRQCVCSRDETTAYLPVSHSVLQTDWKKIQRWTVAVLRGVCVTCFF